MYDKCYFCLDQLPKLKKQSTASFFENFGRSRGTKEPTYITVPCIRNLLECADYDVGSGPFTLTAFHDGPDGLTIDWIEVKHKSKLV